MDVFSTVDFAPSQEFSFQRTTGFFNERKVLNLHPDRMDINELNEALSSLAYGDLGTFLMGRNAPNWAVKVCQVQQYFTQYLLYTTSQCETYLRELTTPQTDPNLAISLHQEIDRLKSEINRVRQKHETENMMYRLMSVRPEVVEALPKCLHCGKVFGVYEFLLVHHRRRHPGLPEPKPPVPSFAPLPQPCQCCLHEDKPPAPPPVVVPVPTPPTISVGLTTVQESVPVMPESEPAPAPQQYVIPAWSESDIFAEGDKALAQQPYVSFDSHMSEYYHNIRKRVHINNSDIEKVYQELKKQHQPDVSSNSTSIF